MAGMAIPLASSFFFSMLAVHLFLAFQVCALVPYDYSYGLGCMREVAAPQYGGGIAANPQLDDGLEGWVAVGNAKLSTGQSSSGNNYGVISNIVEAQSDGVSQSFLLDKDSYYIVSAWFQANASRGRTADVQAKLVAGTGNVTAGWITAKRGCWTMLKGGFTGNATALVELRFETNTPGVDIWIDSISLQPFTQEEWAMQQDHSVEMVRKRRVTLQVAEAHAAISIRQLHPHFPFGNVINALILESTAYQNWFLNTGFRYTVFENELKWQATEVDKGFENYTIPEAMLRFCRSNNLTVRGHNILWDDANFQGKWVKKLTANQRRKAAMKRVKSVVKRFRGDFIHWDVINENLHYQLFSNVTGKNGTKVFELVHRLDPHPIPFLNEFNVVEACDISGKATPQRYLQKIDELRDRGYDGPLGIGLESHFDLYAPNLPYVRASIDVLASTGLPIWITEFTVSDSIPNQLKYLEVLLREFHSHPAVKGLILWSAIGIDKKCYSLCLTDSNYKNVPAGDVVDRFVSEFVNVADVRGTTDVDGEFETLLFYGEYEATVVLPDGATRSLIFKLVPDEGDAAATTLYFKI